MNKKRIVFLWVEKYKNLKDIGINLTADYEFKYDENTDRANTIELVHSNYFPEQISELKNIVAVVGKNGIGKTSILEVVSQTISNEYNRFGFCVFENIDESGSVTLELVRENKTKWVSLEQSFLAFGENIENVKFTVKSNVYNKEQFLGCITYNPNEINKISQGKLNDKSNIDNISSSLLNKFTGFKIYNVLENLDLISNLFDGSNYSKVKIIYPIHSRNYEKYLDKLKNIDLDDNIYNYFHNFDKNYDITALKNYFERSLFLEAQERSQHLVQTIISIFEHYFYECSDLALVLSGIYLHTDFSLETLEELLNESNINLIKRVKNSIDIAEGHLQIYSDYIKQDNESGLRIEFGTSDIRELKMFLKRISEFECDFFTPELIGLSSGQLSLLKIFYGIFYSKLLQRKNIILLLDEAEQSLHPEWQRLFVNCLIQFKKEHLCKDINLQVVFATHSPFLLSDILDENVIYLTSNKVNNEISTLNKSQNHNYSFAANIHELLLGNLFMERTIGEYSAQMIINLYQALSENSITHKIIKSSQAIISKISDKVIQNELQMLLNEKEIEFNALLNNKSMTPESKAELARKYFESGDIDAIVKIIQGN